MKRTVAIIGFNLLILVSFVTSAYVSWMSREMMVATDTPLDYIILLSIFLAVVSAFGNYYLCNP